MGIPLDKAELLAIFLETFFFGIFAVLYFATILVLLQRGPSGRRQQLILIPVSTFMIFIATAHLVIDFVRLMGAFADYAEKEAGGALQYYADISHPLHVVKTAVYVVQTTLGDSVVGWRCYVVYQKNIWIAIPIILLILANLGTGIYVVHSFSIAGDGSNVFDTARGGITTFFTLTMATNVLCTLAIVYRIFFRRRMPSGTQIFSQSLVPVLVGIVESGALYASGVLVLLITYLANSNAQYPALDICTPLVGIVFCLIILQIRFHLGWSSIHHNDPNNQNTNSLSFSHHRSANPGAVSSRRGGRGGGRGGRSGLGTETLDGGATSIPMHIRITQERDVEVAYPDVQGAARVRRLGGGGDGVTGVGEGNGVEEQYDVGSEDDLEKKVSI